MTPESWDALVADFLDSTFAAHPEIAVNSGRHEFDGQLPDWSEAGLTRERDRLTSWRSRLRSIDAQSLDTARAFERDYMIAVIDGMLFWLARADWPHRNPTFYADALDPDVYLSRPYAPLEQRMKAYIKYARAVPAAAQHVRNNLRPPLPRTYIDRGSGAFGGLASFYASDVPPVFAAVSDTALQAEFSAANDAAIAALKDVDAWLQSLRATQTEDFALGPALFREMLSATEGVDTPLEELARIARADLDRNLASLRQACARFAPGKTTHECVALVEARKTAKSPVEEARDQLTQLRAFIAQSDLVTIPGDEQAHVNESPPHMRWNMAYIMIPGPYEKNMPSTYYIAPPDPSWTAAERAAYLPGRANLMFTSVHEVWPGHFLQFLHANRSRSKFGQVFVGYAFAEGWAHYAEEMVWDAGFGDGDPEMHIGQLINALLRNARFVAAIGLHTGGMTVAEAERLFAEDGHQDPGTARQQAARGTFDPAYLNYTLGKLMILKLRDDWVASRGGRAAWKQFHDEVLKFGGPPVPLVRKAMVGGGELMRLQPKAQSPKP
jgi:uncharacterized protein (DUF885 family)